MLSPATGLAGEIETLEIYAIDSLYPHPVLFPPLEPPPPDVEVAKYAYFKSLFVSS